MALTQSAASDPRAHSIGPKKQQIIYIAVASGDTTGTVTCSGLTTVKDCIVTGLNLTSKPTMSGNVITLAFADPVATRAGMVIALGN